MSEAPGSNNSGLLHRVIKITPRVILYVRPAFPVATRGESVASAVIEGPLRGGGRVLGGERERERYGFGGWASKGGRENRGPRYNELGTITRFDGYYRVHEGVKRVIGENVRFLYPRSSWFNPSRLKLIFDVLKNKAVVCI